jgi:hypothetical protein
MARYIIQDSHEVADCLKLLDAFMHAGAHYLTNAEWGCQDGDHTAWIVVEASSDNEARNMVPPVIRDRARLVRLNRFSPEQIRAFHEEAEAGGGGSG